MRTLPLCLVVSLLVANIAQGQTDKRLEGYRVAPGFNLELAAIEPMVINPVTMTFGIDGRLYVIEWREGRQPNDHIKVLTDSDGNGTFDKVEMYMEGLDLPAGIAFWDGWTYITLEHDVVRFKNVRDGGKYDAKEVIVTGFGNDNSHHRVSGLTFGPDGWLYMTTGDSDARAKGSDGSTATVLRCGGVFRCLPDGSRLENVAFGMRNPFGNVAFDDDFNIFHTDNDNEGSPGFTGCRILHVLEGGDYGWRLREGARCCQPDFERATWNGGRPGRLGWITETGRGAPAGLAVLNSDAFPASTKNMLIYPDVFRKLVRAYKLKPKYSTFEVAEEFELLSSDDGMFRPTDAEIGPDGALYILDWRTNSGGAGKLSGDGMSGRIYRLTWSGTAKERARATLDRNRLAKLVGADTDALVEALMSSDYNTRLASSHELIRRGSSPDPSLKGTTSERSTEISKALASLASRPLDKSLLAQAHMITIQDRLAGTSSSLRRDKDKSLDLLFPRHPKLSRRVFDGIARYSSPDDSDLATKIHRWVREATSGKASATHRLSVEEECSLARALGHFSRVKPGDGLQFNRWIPLDLFGLLRDRPVEDVTTRDAYVRGLEAMGEVSLEVLLSEIKGDKKLYMGMTKEETKREKEANRRDALFVLQSWRTPDGLSAILSQATTAESIPEEARANLFRALRELGENVPPDPIAQWLAKPTTADPLPKVVAIHVLTAMGKRAVPATSNLIAILLKDPSPEVKKAALALASNVGSGESKRLLMGLIKDKAAGSDERRLAAAAIRASEDKSLASPLADIYKLERDEPTRVELLKAIGGLDRVLAVPLARGSLDEKNRDLRHEAIGLLGQRPETALEVAEHYNSGKLPKEDLARVIEAVRNHATPELQAATQALLKSTLLAAPKGAEAERLRDFVNKQGNSTRGKSIYLDVKKGGCVTCHRMEGSGGEVGPDLTKVWTTLSFDKRLESLIEPSKEIKEGFGTYKVATKDGRVLVGLLLSSKPEGVTLKDAQGREVFVPARDIEEKTNDPTSLMPVGVVGHLSLGELADLLAFLGDQKAQESLRAK